MDHKMQAISDAAELAHSLRVAQIIDTAEFIRPMGEQILERYAPVIAQINEQAAATAATVAAASSAAQAAMGSMVAQRVMDSMSSEATKLFPLTGIVESLRASLPSDPTIMDSLNVTTPALDAVTQYSLGTEALGAALNLIQTGEIDYEEVVEGLGIRESAEDAATDALSGVGADLPEEHQLDLQQAAALIYVLTWILLVFGIIPEWPNAGGTAAVALLNGEGGRVARNLAPAPRRDSD